MPLRGALRSPYAHDEDEEDASDSPSDEQASDDEDDDQSGSDGDYIEEVYEIVTEDSSDSSSDDEDDLYVPLKKKERPQMHNLHQLGSRFDYDPMRDHNDDDDDPDDDPDDELLDVRIDRSQGFAYIDASSSRRMTAMLPRRKSLFFDEQTGQLVAVNLPRKPDDPPLSAEEQRAEDEAEEQLIELARRGYIEIIDANDSSHRLTGLYPSRFSLLEALQTMDDGSADVYISSDEEDGFGRHQPRGSAARRSFLRVRLLPGAGGSGYNHPDYDLFDPRNPETRKRARRGLKVNLDEQGDEIGSLSFGKWMNKNDTRRGGGEQKFVIIPRSGEDPIEYQRRVDQAAAQISAQAGKRVTVRVSQRVSRRIGADGQPTAAGGAPRSSILRPNAARQSRVAFADAADGKRRVSFVGDAQPPQRPTAEAAGGRFAQAPTGRFADAAGGQQQRRRPAGRRAVKLGTQGMDDNDEYYLPAGYSKWQKREAAAGETAAPGTPPVSPSVQRSAQDSAAASAGAAAASDSAKTSAGTAEASGSPATKRSELPVIAGGQVEYVRDARTVVDSYDDPLARRKKPRRGAAAAAAASPPVQRAEQCSETSSSRDKEMYVPMGFNKWQQRTPAEIEAERASTSAQEPTTATAATPRDKEMYVPMGFNKWQQRTPAEIEADRANEPAPKASPSTSSEPAPEASSKPAAEATNSEPASEVSTSTSSEPAPEASSSEPAADISASPAESKATAATEDDYDPLKRRSSRRRSMFRVVSVTDDSGGDRGSGSYSKWQNRAPSTSYEQPPVASDAEATNDQPATTSESEATAAEPAVSKPTPVDKRLTLPPSTSPLVADIGDEHKRVSLPPSRVAAQSEHDEETAEVVPRHYSKWISR